MNKRILLALSAALVIVLAVGIYFSIEPKLTNTGQASPPVVHIGVLPDMSENDLQRRYDPLLAYLSEKTGLNFRLILPVDYAELLQLFGAGEVDLALFGGLTFVKADALHKAEPLVMRDVDTRFISVFVVRGSDPATRLVDLKGKVLAFGSSLSTSGHLMPRFFLKNNKRIDPDEFFNDIVYSGAHDKTAYMVRDGKADLGAVNAEIIDAMLMDGRLKQRDLRVVWETPPYANYVWAVRQHLDDDIKTQLRDAFLELDINAERHRKVLAGLGARSFFPAGRRMFQPLKQIAASLGLLSAE